MIVSSRRQRLLLAALGAFIFPLAQAADGMDSGFMPKGGRALLLQQLFGAPGEAAQLRELVQARRSEPEWRAFIEPRARRR
jgi:hypothetical protein